MKHPSFMGEIIFPNNSDYFLWGSVWGLCIKPTPHYIYLGCCIKQNIEVEKRIANQYSIAHSTVNQLLKLAYLKYILITYWNVLKYSSL